jgi:hypothetical protein
LFVNHEQLDILKTMMIKTFHQNYHAIYEYNLIIPMIFSSKIIKTIK